MNLPFFGGIAVWIADWQFGQFAVPVGVVCTHCLLRICRFFLLECALLFVIPWIPLTGYAPASWVLAGRTAELAVAASLGVWLLAVTVLSTLALSYHQSVCRSVVRYDLPLTPVLSPPLLIVARSQPGRLPIARMQFSGLLR